MMEGNRVSLERQQGQHPSATFPDQVQQAVRHEKVLTLKTNIKFVVKKVECKVGGEHRTHWMFHDNIYDLLCSLKKLLKLSWLLVSASTDH